MLNTLAVWAWVALFMSHLSCYTVFPIQYCSHYSQTVYNNKNTFSQLFMSHLCQKRNQTEQEWEQEAEDSRRNGKSNFPWCITWLWWWSPTIAWNGTLTKILPPPTLPPSNTNKHTALVITPLHPSIQCHSIQTPVPNLQFWCYLAWLLLLILCTKLLRLRLSEHVGLSVTCCLFLFIFYLASQFLWKWGCKKPRCHGIFTAQPGLWL